MRLEEHPVTAALGRCTERPLQQLGPEPAAGEGLKRRAARRARRAALDRSGVRLQALSPLATLARGYAVVRAEGAVVRDAAAVAPGSRLDVQLTRGRLGARVEEIRP